MDKIYWPMFSNSWIRPKLLKKNLSLSKNFGKRENLTCKRETLAQCVASYFGDPGKFSMGFSIVFQAGTGKKLLGKNHVKKIPGPAKLMLNITLLCYCLQNV